MKTIVIIPFPQIFQMLHFLTGCNCSNNGLYKMLFWTFRLYFHTNSIYLFSFVPKNLIIRYLNQRFQILLHRVVWCHILLYSLFIVFYQCTMFSFLELFLLILWSIYKGWDREQILRIKCLKHWSQLILLS